MSSKLYQGEVRSSPSGGGSASKRFVPGRDTEDSSGAHRAGTVIVIVLPFVALLASFVLLWNKAVGVTDIALLFVMYVVSALGITVGFHRMLTHGSFQTTPLIRGIFTVAGSLAVEGRPTHWVADHRRHHKYSDREGDPHSPHAGFKPGFWGSVKGAFHAHIGWMVTGRQSSVTRFAPDLLKDEAVVRISRAFPWFIVLTLLIPALAGFALSGGKPMAALTGAFWGGLVRMCVTHHVTWSINSICHMFGKRDFLSDDESRNVWWLSLPSMGESWHNGHHAFPASAVHGLKPWQQWLDPSAWVILGLEKLGLAWDVIRPDDKRLEAKANA